MATYAISDIHGAYHEFVQLLQKIQFRYDGSDTLYLLGDYIDWGEEPIRTLLLIYTMDQRYDFVHVTMGNHELMFLQTLDSGFDGIHANDVSDNWLYTNHGLHTWLEFLSLPDAQQEALVRWLAQLRLSFTCEAGGRTWMLAHAYPYYYDIPCTPAEHRRRVQDAVWHRMLLHENPFQNYTGTIPYDGLVCGHTISATYYQEIDRMQAAQRRPFPGADIFAGIRDAEKQQASENNRIAMCIDPREAAAQENFFPQAPRNRIFYGEKFIDIDCGAKCLGMDSSADESTLAAVSRAQLSCLRLDDMAEFYVCRSFFQSSVPQMNEKMQQARRMISQYMRSAQQQLFGSGQES